MRMAQEAMPFFVKIGLIARCRCVIVASAGRLVAYTVERNPIGRTASGAAQQRSDKNNERESV